MPFNFNADHLPEMASEYVAWVDVMGTQVAMSRSIKITANFIFKLHIAALRAQFAGIQIYPVMDGFYASTPNRNQMLSFLRTVFKSVAEEFNATVEPHHRFMIRGGLAFGPVIHGRDVGQCATELQNNLPYSNSILLGMPMVQAHLSERDAPPFGVFVHESARVFAPDETEPLHWIWWKWDDPLRAREEESCARVGFTRYAPRIEVDTSLPGQRVVRVLEELKRRGRKPEAIVIVHQVQSSKLAPTGERILREVHGPDLVGAHR
jgi:hypothetical protein